MIKNTKFALVTLVLMPHAALASDRIALAFPSENSTFSAVRPLSQIQKDQFESSSDFAKRICPSVEKALGIKSGSVVSFSVPTLQNNYYYKADKRSFTFKVDGYIPGDFNRTLGSLNKYVGVVIASSRRTKDSFVGQNVFGVTKKIDVIEVDNVLLALPARKHHVAWSIETQLSAPPDEARKLDKDMQIIVSMKIQKPCFLIGSYHVAPDIKSPDDYTSNFLGLIGSRDATWKIVKISTGQILQTGSF